MDPKLTIIRASAGSGKTHRLTGEFLKFLIHEPTDYFKSVLAVTFTNKATEEMKSRIVEELNKLAHHKKSDYLVQLMELTGFAETHVRNKASAILQQILHNYSWFSVETIDSFFQRIIRAFTRELAIPGNYNVETDTGPILQFAVDRLIDGIEEKSEMLNWLIQFAEERIDEGKSWDIRKELFNLGKEIFKEEFTANSQEIYDAVSDKSKLQQFRTQLLRIKSDTEKQLQEFGKQGVEKIATYGFADSDLYQGSRGAITFFSKLASKQMVEPNSYIHKLAEDAENWPSAKTPRKHEVIAAAQTTLLPLLKQVLEYIESQKTNYYTAQEINKNIYALGILVDIYEYVRSYRLEKNTFILSDSPGFIFKIIDQNDAPFIYEKMGNRYKHLLIDEFQDTSVLQWFNFKPLISNSLSIGNNCILVGDVKQSIYRWRNSNWEVLASGISTQYDSEMLNEEKLAVNWRSKKCIVDFNNWLFPRASELLQGQFAEKINSTGMTVESDLFDMTQLYGDVEQETAPKNKEKGRVRMQFFSHEDRKDDEDYYQLPLIEEINKLLDAGYLPGDIAILVRGKTDGMKLARFLIDSNASGQFARQVGVISNESLFISASQAVNVIVSALMYLHSPTDDINRGKLTSGYTLLQMQQQTPAETMELSLLQGFSSSGRMGVELPEEFIKNAESLRSLPLYELTERIISLFRADRLPAEVPYVHAFLDVMHDFVHNSPADIGRFLEFWEEDGLTKSISAAESQDSIRILTIHKSKGLQYRAVIVPFCNWLIDQKSGTILWTRPLSEQFNYLPIVPVAYGKGLLQTEFAGTYLTELFKSYVDNLNLLYVALTRAKESLTVFPVYKASEKKDKSYSGIGDLLFDVVSNTNGFNFESAFDRNTGIFETGSFEENSAIKEQTESATVYLEACEGSRASDRLFFDPKGYEYFKDSLHTGAIPASMGSVMHDILAHIVHEADIERVLNDAKFKGLVTEQEHIKYNEILSQRITDPQVHAWFDGSGEVLNETDILLPGGQSKRPDRVVLFKDSIAVIDYKFGSSDALEQHRSQVQQYTQIIAGMHPEKVSGYLWYVNEERVVGV